MYITLFFQLINSKSVIEIVQGEIMLRKGLCSSKERPENDYFVISPSTGTTQKNYHPCNRSSPQQVSLISSFHFSTHTRKRKEKKEISGSVAPRKAWEKSFGRGGGRREKAGNTQNQCCVDTKAEELWRHYFMGEGGRGGVEKYEKLGGGGSQLSDIWPLRVRPWVQLASGGNPN